MTVKELIEQLQALDPESRVFIRGYEAGYNDINNIDHEEMVLNVNSVWYYGKHELLKSMEKRDKILNKESEHKSVKGIIIGYEEDFNTR
jgi:hypothetical protein